MRLRNLFSKVSHLAFELIPTRRDEFKAFLTSIFIAAVVSALFQGWTYTLLVSPRDSNEIGIQLSLLKHDVDLQDSELNETYNFLLTRHQHEIKHLHLLKLTKAHKIFLRRTAHELNELLNENARDEGHLN